MACRSESERGISGPAVTRWRRIRAHAIHSRRIKIVLLILGVGFVLGVTHPQVLVLMKEEQQRVDDDLPPVTFLAGQSSKYSRYAISSSVSVSLKIGLQT